MHPFKKSSELLDVFLFEFFGVHAEICRSIPVSVAGRQVGDRFTGGVNSLGDFLRGDKFITFALVLRIEEVALMVGGRPHLRQ